MSEERHAVTRKGRRLLDWYTAIMAFVGWVYLFEVARERSHWGYLAAWCAAVIAYLFGFWFLRRPDDAVWQSLMRSRGR